MKYFTSAALEPVTLFAHVANPYKAQVFNVLLRRDAEQPAKLSSFPPLAVEAANPKVSELI
jgi:hypothetical protein